MSVSNKTFKNISIDFSHKFRDLNDRTDTIDSETNECSYNRDSGEEKNEEKDYRNQMIDLPKLIRQLSLARVVLKRLPVSTEATKLQTTDDLTPVDVESHADSGAIEDTCDIVDDAEKKSKSTTSCNRKKPADLIKRYCPKCKMIEVDAAVCIKRLCSKCETPITYQCAGCEKQYNNYKSMIGHSYYCSRQTIHSCSRCNYTTKYPANLHRHVRIVHEGSAIWRITYDRYKFADLIKRHCPKCKTLAVDASVCLKQLCTKCGTPLDFLCVRCDKQCSNYQSMMCHLDSKCNTQNLDLKCPECDYRTHAKTLMTKHISSCLSGINFICGLCEHSTRSRQNLLRHMFSMHKDILEVDCSQCKTKRNKCVQCKNMVLFCETCHTGFSSTDRFEEHQKSCKQPVLECKYCPFKTDVNSELKKHIKLKHLIALMSQN